MSVLNPFLYMTIFAVYYTLVGLALGYSASVNEEYWSLYAFGALLIFNAILVYGVVGSRAFISYSATLLPLIFSYGIMLYGVIKGHYDKEPLTKYGIHALFGLTVILLAGTIYAGN